MLVIKRELNYYDFIDEFEGLENVGFADERKALGLIFHALCDVYDGAVDEMMIRDYIRYQVQEMDADYFIDQYGNLLDLNDEADENEKHEAIENCINYYSHYIGNYEYDGVIYYLFDEF